MYERSGRHENHIPECSTNTRSSMWEGGAPHCYSAGIPSGGRLPTRRCAVGPGRDGSVASPRTESVVQLCLCREGPAWTCNDSDYERGVGISLKPPDKTTTLSRASEALNEHSDLDASEFGRTMGLNASQESSVSARDLACTSRPVSRTPAKSCKPSAATRRHSRMRGQSNKAT